MERFCWKGHVNPGKLEEYAAKHNAMCRQMEELMRAAGMRNYSIWANGEDTIGYSTPGTRTWRACPAWTSTRTASPRCGK